MATFREIMDAAHNADKAGDTEAAARLVALARSAMPKQAPVGPASPAGTIDPLIPSADGPDAAPRPDRFGDTIAAATEAPVAATKLFARGMMDETVSPTHQALPDWMPERVKGMISLAGDTLGAGVSAAGSTVAFGAGLTGEVLGGTPTNEKKLARDLMMGLEVAVPELSGVSATARASGAAARAVKNAPETLSQTQEIAQAADDLGITPSLGAGGKVRSMTAAGLEKTPIAGATIAKDATRFVGEVEAAFDSVVSQIGRPVNAASAGDSLQGGLKKFVNDFKARSATLYDDVGKKIPAGTNVATDETVGMIRDVERVFAETPEIAKQIGLTNLSKLADDLEGGVSWEVATSLRSEIGKAIGKMKGALSDQSDARLKSAYEALTNDLEAAARAAGDEPFKAWRRANNYYRRGADRIDSALDKTISADSPERAFEAFTGMLRKDRSTSDVNRLYKIKASMPQREWDEVSATIVDRLGRSKSGQQNAEGTVFSPAKLLTEWNNMSSEARSILLPPDVRNELTKLAKVSEGVKLANADRNFSNTGGINQAMFAGLGFGMAPTTTAGVLTGATLSAKAMTSRRFLKAANRMARGDEKMMRALAKSSDPISRDATTILRLAAADAATQAANTNNIIPEAAEN